MCFKFVKKIFHNITVHFKRTYGNCLPCESQPKRYGNWGEDELYRVLKTGLPLNAHVLRNVCLNEKTAKGDVDFIVVYENKIFILELKTWKGHICQEGEDFMQRKYFYGQVYTKFYRSPIKQMNRHVYVLNDRFPYLNFEKVIVFYGADSVHASRRITYFTNLGDVIPFILHKGRVNEEKDVLKFLKQIVCYDTLYSEGFWASRTEKVLISAEDLRFDIKGRLINKKDIKHIHIVHHYAFDELFITLTNNQQVRTVIENGEVSYLLNGQKEKVAFSKLDDISIQTH